MGARPSTTGSQLVGLLMAGSCITLLGTGDRSGPLVLKSGPVFGLLKTRPLTGSQRAAAATPIRRSGAQEIPGSLGAGGTGRARRRACGCDELLGFGRMVGIGVQSLVALALRPEFSIPARMPPTARSAPRGGRQGLLVLTAGLAGGGRPVPALSLLSVIEALTGRKVLAFLSQAHVEPDLTVEIFLMDGPPAGFGALELVDPPPTGPESGDA